MKTAIFSGKMLVLGAAVLLSSSFININTASAAAVATNSATCGAGSATSYNLGYNKSLKIVWNGNGTFTVTASEALQNKVKFFISDYILTSDKYAGGCFDRDASKGTYPQTHYKTVEVTLEKGFVGSRDISVELPTTCENVQVDLYTGNSQGMAKTDNVTQSGHDNYGYVAGNIMPTANNPACIPGRGGDTPTPPVVETPVTPVAAVTPKAELVNTGLKVSFISILSALTLSAAAFVATRRNKVSE